MDWWRRSRMFRVVVTCSSVSLLALAAVFGSLLLLFGAQCQERVSQDLLSPDGRYAVRAVEENCFVTTPFKTDVLISDSRSWPFSSKRDVFSYRGRLEDSNFSWQDSNTLVIEYRRCQEIYGQDSKWSSVEIIYREDCGP